MPSTEHPKVDSGHGKVHHPEKCSPRSASGIGRILRDTAQNAPEGGRHKAETDRNKERVASEKVSYIHQPKGRASPPRKPSPSLVQRGARSGPSSNTRTPRGAFDRWTEFHKEEKPAVLPPIAETVTASQETLQPRNRRGLPKSRIQDLDAGRTGNR